MPGLRENLEARLRRDIQVDEEFAGLIPPLSEYEYSRLEQSIVEEGCREAIIVWDGVIVDGHNRYRICTAHGIPFRTKSKDFSSREDAMLWMMQNQLARRNLNDFQRVEFVRRYESAVKAQAKERQGKRNDLRDNIVPKSAQSSKSRDELAQMAGVGHSTYERAITVMDNAPEAVKEAVRRQELSINAGYEVTKLEPDKQEEISQRISEGETPRKVVSEVRKRKANAEKFTISPSQADTEKVKSLAQSEGVSIQEMLVRLVHEALSGEKYAG